MESPPSKPEKPAAPAPPPQTSVQKLTWPLRVALFSATLKVAPRAAAASFHLGNALAEVGRLKEALPRWVLAAEVEPTRFSAVKNASSLLLAEGRVDEALPLLKRAAEATHPHKAEALSLYGKALQKAGKIAEAAEAFEGSLALHPEQEPLRLVLGLLCEKTKRPDRALFHYEKLTDPKLAAQVAPRIAALKKAQAAAPS